MKSNSKQRNFARLFQLIFLSLLVLSLKSEAASQIRVGASALDMTFGDQGKLIDDYLNLQSNVSIISQSDGKIVSVNRSTDVSDSNSLRVTRFNPNGTLDTSFAQAGRLRLGASPNAAYYGVRVQPDGKMLVFGAYYPSPGEPKVEFLIKRLNDDGSADASFGSGGMVATNLSNASKYINQIVDLLVQPDGKIVALGSTTTDDVSGGNWSMDTSFSAARYLPDGSLDPGFGAGGKLVVYTEPRTFASSLCPKLIYGYDTPSSGALQADGKILIVGRTQAPSFSVSACAAPFDQIVASSFAAMRLNENGTPDAAFGENGIVSLASSLPSGYYSANQYGANAAVKIFPQPGGKLLIGGAIFEPYSNVNKNGYFRMNANGSFDDRFADSGVLRKQNIGVQPDGKIIAPYSTNVYSGEPCFLARYDENGVFETNLNTFLPRIPILRQLTFACDNITVQSDGKILVQGSKAFYNETFNLRYTVLMRLVSGAESSLAAR